MDIQEHITTKMRLVLQGEYTRRCQANHRYSLRSFAAYLGIEPSALSKMIKGKRNITIEMCKRISDRLDLDLNQLLFQDNEGEFDVIEKSKTELISKWYYYAILELSKTPNFHLCPKWIAKALSISVTESQIALERLELLGFITKTENGKDINDSANTTIGSTVPARKLVAMQTQYLQKAMEALATIEIDERDQSNLTLAMSPLDIEFAKEEIKKFRRQLCKKIEERNNPHQVYNLTVSLIPLTNIEYNKEHLQ